MLKSLNKYISFLILYILFFPVYAEDKIEIWNKSIKKNSEITKPQISNDTGSPDNKISNAKKIDKDILIEKEILDVSQEIKVYGIHDPAVNDFDLNMWLKTDSDKVRASIKRIDKMNLSKTATKLFEKTIFSYAYPPRGMDEKEFTNFRIN